MFHVEAYLFMYTQMIPKYVFQPYNIFYGLCICITIVGVYLKMKKSL